MTNTAVILAGGKGSRLKYVDKGFLIYKNKSFIENLIDELSCFKHVSISTNNSEYSKFNLSLIEDAYKDIGAMGGLYSSLSFSNSEWTFFTSVDNPLFIKDIALYLSDFISSDYKAVIAKDHNGKIHPLCGYYSKNILPTIETQISKKEYGIMRMLKCVPTKIVDLSKTTFYHSKMMSNINRKEDLLSLPIIIAISGKKNSGKTTLVCDIIKELNLLGKTVATIKHTSHNYPFDKENSDTFLHRKSGSLATAVYSPNSYMINSCSEKPNFIKMLTDYDVILLEGFKDSDYPKIEVIRDDVFNEELKNVIARYSYTDVTKKNTDNLPLFSSTEIKEIVSLLLNYNLEVQL